MCGIIAYIGNKNAFPILINGLQKLEYRGYDSAGVAVYHDKIYTQKAAGKVKNIETPINSKILKGNIGIGHTRWATHGEPTNTNSHPHTSNSGKITIAHNGIIENFSEIKDQLLEKGYIFHSQTDTEVLVNLIDYFYIKSNDYTIEKAVKSALSSINGTYGLVVICQDKPEQIIAVRKESPLVIGLGKNEYFVASDATPIIEHTKRVIYLNNDDFVILNKETFTIKSSNNEEITPHIEELDWELGNSNKGDFEHYMLKEIFEQPKCIRDTCRGRIDIKNNKIVLGGLIDILPKLKECNKLYIIGCGTSWHAGITAKYMIEEMARIPVQVDYASEFKYRNPILSKDDFVLTISQSGETADTLTCVRMAKKIGATVLGICNVAGSSLSRETNAGVFTHAGSEISVASTKAFTAQLTVLTMFAGLLGYKRNTISQQEYKDLISELIKLPEKIEILLNKNQHYKEISKKFQNAMSSLFLGRGIMFPVALEGALKLKEISYIHAEGYPAGEIKHGPIALVEESVPIVSLAFKDHNYKKIVSNIQEVKARKGNNIVLTESGNKEIKALTENVIEIPKCSQWVAPILYSIPLQLISYHTAVAKGFNVDQPRNLAKSVTVE